MKIILVSTSTMLAIITLFLFTYRQEKQNLYNALEDYFPLILTQHQDKVVRADIYTPVIINNTETNATLPSEKDEGLRPESIQFDELINDDVFEIIREAYIGAGFSTKFQRGNVELYDFYKEQFIRLIKLERTFFNERTQREYLITEFGEMNYTLGSVLTINGERDKFDPNDFRFLFFDMNGDGTPDLGITNGVRFTYIFTYDSVSDSFLLWLEMPPGASRIIGTREISEDGRNTPFRQSWTILDENAKVDVIIKIMIAFYILDDDSMNNVYYVSLPVFADEERNIALTDVMKEQFISVELSLEHSISHPHYFRVTETQFEELMEIVFKPYERTKYNCILYVSFTFEELFVYLYGR